MIQSIHHDHRLLPVKQMAVWLAMVCVAACLSTCRKETRSGAQAPLARMEALRRFQPPSDGQLTDAQVDRYLRVRRASRGRTDAEAARAVGVDPEEYSWVRSRVIEALVALDSRKVRTASEETYAKTIASLRRARQSARDRESQRTLDEQIAGLEREKASLRQIDSLPSAATFNARRVAPRRAEIEALSP